VGCDRLNDSMVNRVVTEVGLTPDGVEQLGFLDQVSRACDEHGQGEKRLGRERHHAPLPPELLLVEVEHALVANRNTQPWQLGMQGGDR
jgi:hypothetical protein